MQVPQLLAVHISRGICHYTVGALGLGEGDHVADGLGTGHQHHQAIQAEGQPGVRGRAVLQGIEQEAEFLLCLLLVDLQDAEHHLLHIALVDTHAAATQFATV